MHTLDLTNLTCPWAIIKTKQAMEQLVKDDTLLISVNDPSFAIDCQVYVKQTGIKLLSTWHKNHTIYFLLKK